MERVGHCGLQVPVAGRLDNAGERQELRGFPSFMPFLAKGNELLHAVEFSAPDRSARPGLYLRGERQSTYYISLGKVQIICHFAADAEIHLSLGSRWRREMPMGSDITCVNVLQCDIVFRHSFNELNIVLIPVSERCKAECSGSLHLAS